MSLFLANFLRTKSGSKFDYLFLLGVTLTQLITYHVD